MRTGVYDGGPTCWNESAPAAVHNRTEAKATVAALAVLAGSAALMFVGMVTVVGAVGLGILSFWN
jgi:hypothetical protein